MEKKRTRVELTVDDCTVVRRTVHYTRMAAGINTKNTRGAGFQQLASMMMFDRMRELNAENDAQLRMAALIGDNTIDIRVDGGGEDARWCTICFNSVLSDDRNVAVPCGHLYACSKCCPQLDTCSVCRQPVSEYGDKTQVKQVYDASAALGDTAMATVAFRVPGKKTTEYIDQFMLVREDDKQTLEQALKVFIHEQELTTTSALDLAIKSPSIFWSVYHYVQEQTKQDNNDEKDIEEQMNSTICQFLGIQPNSNRRRRRCK